MGLPGNCGHVDQVISMSLLKNTHNNSQDTHFLPTAPHWEQIRFEAWFLHLFYKTLSQRLRHNCQLHKLALCKVSSATSSATFPQGWETHPSQYIPVPWVLIADSTHLFSLCLLLPLLNPFIHTLPFVKYCLLFATIPNLLSSLQVLSRLENFCPIFWTWCVPFCSNKNPCALRWDPAIPVSVGIHYTLVIGDRYF